MKSIIPIILAAIILTGCGTTGNKIVPSNRYKDDEKEITLAQDNQAKNITINKRVVDKKGNTNFVTIKITGLEAKNSPDTINAAGQANAASIAGYAHLFQTGFDTAFKAFQLYLKGHGIPAPSGSPETAIPGDQVVRQGDKTYKREPDIYAIDGKLFRFDGETMTPLP